MGTDDTPATAGDRTRDRILDAAAACVLAQGWRTTSLTDIAERANLTRPTVYKHGGDRNAIAEGLRAREQERFVGHLTDVLAQPADRRDWFVDGVVFTVGYAEDHALLQHMLEHEPDVVLPWLTRDAGPLLARMVDVLAPHVEQAVTRGEVRSVDTRMTAEWVARLAISLVLTPSVTVPHDQPEQLRRFVEGLFELGLTPRTA